MTQAETKAQEVYDQRGIPIRLGDIVKVFHFIGARRKRHYMYKQCLGVGKYRPEHDNEYLFFSHLSMDDERYHEKLGQQLEHYEIVQSIKCDHEERERQP